MVKFDWATLEPNGRAAALARPPGTQAASLRAGVADIIAQVRADGDAALLTLTQQFDDVSLAALQATDAELAAAWPALDAAVQQAIDAAIGRIKSFHAACQPQDVRQEVSPGVVCERVSRPIRTVGLYVPAGSAPLPSTTIMLGVPAQLAGCANVVLCSPPGPDGRVNATVVAAASRLGISQVFAVGGAQAIAAMAFGTESVPACDKIYGPGNAWVTEAKQQVSQHPQGAAIDMPAGPSEVMVVADACARADFVAADLLSQAEHGPDSQVVLVALEAGLAEAVAASIEQQLALLSRADIARQALQHARFIIVKSRAQALDVINAYAPEHLILQVREARELLPQIQAAGSIFLGALTPESLGDYCSGTNHVLPTYGYARSYSGLAVDSFQTRMTVQEVSAQGLQEIGPVAVTLANVEGLTAHARAVTLRLESLES